MKKPMLILIAVAISVSIITSGICGGPIDLIFTGWRDTSHCALGTLSWFPGEALTNYERDKGSTILIFIVIVTLLLSSLLYGLFKIFSWFKKQF